MMIYTFSVLVLAASLSCLVSGFYTHFEVEEESKKPQAVEESKDQKPVEYSPSDGQFKPQGIEVKVIPIESNMFIRTEDLLNITPLKLATAISAQHLLSTLQNIPVSGDSPQDTLNMLSGIIKELNKTAQIIKLTAEYVNISGHYILSALDQYASSNSDQDAVKETLTTIKNNLLKTVSENVVEAVKELNDKTKEREITGTDILISSAYHIVSSFQEMTNEVLKLNANNTKNASSPPNIEITPASGEQSSTTGQNIRQYIPVIPEQRKSHKSIKKDQSTSNADKLKRLNIGTFPIQMTFDNLNGNQDLTVEVFSPETFIHNNKKELETEKKQQQTLKVPEDLKIRYTPERRIQLLESPKDEGLSGKNIVDENKSTQTNNFDKELASSAVDSLSNVPWVSSELEVKSLNNNVPVNNLVKTSPRDLFNLLELLVPGSYKNGSLQAKPKLECDEVKPVCGIDRNLKKFIVFLNDCKREAHNKLYGTDYTWYSMENCVSMLLNNQDLGAQGIPMNRLNDVDLRPR